MANTNPVTVARKDNHWQLTSASGEVADLVQLPNGHTWWLLPPGDRDEDNAWDGWVGSEAEALGHAIACLAWQPA